jgi:hypothetical protein
MNDAPSGLTHWCVPGVALRPFDTLRVAPSAAEGRRCSGPSRAKSRDGGRLRLVATIDQRAVVDRILRHLGLPTDLSVPHPARAPPLAEARREVPFGGGTDVADVEPC